MKIHIPRNPAVPLCSLPLAQHTAARHSIVLPCADYDALRVYIHRPTAPKSYFIAEAAPRPGGEWEFGIEPGMLPDVGSAGYEIFGVTGGEENETREYLGSGRIFVTERAFDASAAVPLDVPDRVVIYDEAGAAHYLTAVPDGMGNYTSVVD